MTQESVLRAGHDAVVGADVKRGGRLSPFWALPVVAAAIAGWLAYVALTEKGPLVAIAFKTAAGIETGKTRVKHHDIELGVVERVEPSPDLSHVVVRARMNKIAATHLREGTSFWVVRPRVSLSGLSGLETLVSGAYIEMDPGEGGAASSFKGLEEPPVVRSEVPGREFVLSAQKLGSLGPGSPVYFRGIQVGEVTGQVFAGIDQGIEVRIFVREPYDALVYEGTRFWNASGISLSTRAGGFKIDVESVQALLTGGIVFDTAEVARKGESAKEGTSFPLFDDRIQAQDASYTRTSRLIVEFDGSVRGLEVGAPVDFRGMKIGKVLDFHLEFDPDGEQFRIPVTIEVEFERIQLTSGHYEQYGGGRLLPILVARGLRAQLRSASFITGQLMVALDFFPDAPPAEVTMSDTYPKLPAMPNELESMTRSVGATLDKVAALPLDAVVKDLRDVLGSARELMANPDLKDTARSVNVLLTSLRQASDSADATLKRANATLAGYGGDSKFQGDLRDMVRQLQETLRSVRLLANYLEQHPEALVRGKAAAAR